MDSNRRLSGRQMFSHVSHISFKDDARKKNRRVGVRDEHLRDARPIDEGQHGLYLDLEAWLSVDQSLSAAAQPKGSCTLVPRTTFISLNGDVH